MTFETKDSGQRQEFDTGSRRDTREGKGRYDLLPFFGIRRLVGLYERGAEKYGDRNWEKGQPLSRYIDSGLRHAFQAAAGYTDEDHLAAVVWNFLAIIDHQERIARGELPADLDDLPTPAFDTPDELVDDSPLQGELFPPTLFPTLAPPAVPHPAPGTSMPGWWWQQQITSNPGAFTLTNINVNGDRPYTDVDHVGHNHD